MAIPSIVVQKTWGDPDSTTPASGTVRFDLTGQLIVGGEAISLMPAIAKLVEGAINQPLTPTYGIDGQETSPALYWVAEAIQGAPVRRYAVQVPAAPEGSRSVSDGSTVVGTQVITSASAAFTSDDEGLVLWSPAFPVGVTIMEVLDDHTAQLSGAALTTHAGDVELLIGAQVDLTSLDPITQA